MIVVWIFSLVFIPLPLAAMNNYLKIDNHTSQKLLIQYKGINPGFEGSLISTIKKSIDPNCFIELKKNNIKEQSILVFIKKNGMRIGVYISQNNAHKYTIIEDEHSTLEAIKYDFDYLGR